MPRGDKSRALLTSPHLRGAVTVSIGRFAATPPPPYYVVVFSGLRRPSSNERLYKAAAKRLVALALRQPGCLGVEAAAGDDGFGITVAYFSDQSSIASWANNAEHVDAQRRGREKCYSHYEVRIARVERAHHLTIRAPVEQRSRSAQRRARY
jgi:heme-degrading monooxygenase HmoA